MLSASSSSLAKGWIWYFWIELLVEFATKPLKNVTKTNKHYNLQSQIFLAIMLPLLLNSFIYDDDIIYSMKHFALYSNTIL